MGNSMWSTTHQTASLTMLDRVPSSERLNQLKEENSSLKKATNYQEDTIRQLKTKLSRVIALAKRSSTDPSTASQIKFHEETLGFPNGTLNSQAFPTEPAASVNRRARSASRSRPVNSARARSARKNPETVSLALLEEAHNEICTLKAEVSKRVEEVTEWQIVAQKLNSELSSQRQQKTDVEQKLSQTQQSLLKTSKEIQIKESQIEALQAELDASRLLQEKVELQNAKLLELEQTFAQRETQTLLVNELEQRIAELERERDIVQDSNRKLIERSEQLKERMAAHETHAGATDHDEDQGILQDMLLQLQDKFETLERHIETVVAEAKMSDVSSKPKDKPRKQDRPLLKDHNNSSKKNSTTKRGISDNRHHHHQQQQQQQREQQEHQEHQHRHQEHQHRHQEHQHRHHNHTHQQALQTIDSDHDKQSVDRVEGIYEKDEPKLSILSNGSEPPQPKPRRKSLVKDKMSTSSSGEGFNCDRRESLLETNSSHRRLKSRVAHNRRPAILRNEATQTSQCQPKDTPSNRISQITKILSSDDSISEVTDMSLMNVNAPVFEIHIDKALLISPLSKKGTVVNWELGEFDPQSTPVGHLCDKHMIFNCTARYILEDVKQINGAALRLVVATADGEIFGECNVDQVKSALSKPTHRHSHSEELRWNKQAVGQLDFWLRYLPKPD